MPDMRCVAAHFGGRDLHGMRDHHDARLEIRMPAASRRELDQLANEVGLSTADVVRISIRRLLQNPEALLRLSQASDGASP